MGVKKCICTLLNKICGWLEAFNKKICSDIRSNGKFLIILFENAQSGSGFLFNLIHFVSVYFTFESGIENIQSQTLVSCLLVAKFYVNTFTYNLCTKILLKYLKTETVSLSFF